MLARSDNRIIGGVCGGIANYFNIDPTFIRIIFALLIFCPYVSIGLIYIIMWIIMPEE